MISTSNKHFNGKEKTRFNTLAGSVGFLPNESEDPNRSALSVLLKKSSDEVPLKGSLSLKGSPPNGSRKKDKAVRKG